MSEQNGSAPVPSPETEGPRRVVVAIELPIVRPANVGPQKWIHMQGNVLAAAIAELAGQELKPEHVVAVEGGFLIVAGPRDGAQIVEVPTLCHVCEIHEAEYCDDCACAAEDIAGVQRIGDWQHDADGRWCGFGLPDGLRIVIRSVGETCEISIIRAAAEPASASEPTK